MECPNGLIRATWGPSRRCRQDTPSLLLGSVSFLDSGALRPETDYVVNLHQLQTTQSSEGFMKEASWLLQNVTDEEAWRFWIFLSPHESPMRRKLRRTNSADVFMEKTHNHILEENVGEIRWNNIILAFKFLKMEAYFHCFRSTGMQRYT